MPEGEYGFSPEGAEKRKQYLAKEAERLRKQREEPVTEVRPEAVEELLEKVVVEPEKGAWVGKGETVELPDVGLTPAEEAPARVATAYGGHVAAEEVGAARGAAEAVEVSKVDERAVMERLTAEAIKMVGKKIEAGMEPADLESLLIEQLEEVEKTIDDLEEAEEPQETLIKEQYQKRQILDAQIEETRRLRKAA
ncbi:hypothetical protein IH979_00020 [Patescibacteria group bacterium]|nr:hypothetical protein [Patescibacteria group bacterium]